MALRRFLGIAGIAAMVTSAGCAGRDPGPLQVRTMGFRVPCGERSAKDLVIPTHTAEPRYPPAAASQGIEGSVPRLRSASTAE